jgi:thiamine kinase-like enzyme
MRPVTPEERVRALPCWQGLSSIKPLTGGVSNASFVVMDATGKYVARVGEDYPAHHVFRARELAVTRAAHAIGLSPPVVYDEPGIMVVAFLKADTYGEADVRADAVRCVEILRRCHREMPRHMTGPGAIFWVFHVLRDYAHTLKAAGHRHTPNLPGWLAVADKLEAAQVALPIVFGHHDLLPSNFMNDGERLWLIDWEYGAFGTAMFDLANMASNSALGRIEEDALLDVYFGRRANEALWRSFDAMKIASALREAMWGMVSELYLNAPGVDYVAYAEQFLGRYEALLAGYQERYGRL